MLGVVTHAIEHISDHTQPKSSVWLGVVTSRYKEQLYTESEFPILYLQHFNQLQVFLR